MSNCTTHLRGESRFDFTILGFDKFPVSIFGESFGETVLAPLERQGLLMNPLNTLGTATLYGSFALVF